MERYELFKGYKDALRNTINYGYTLETLQYHFMLGLMSVEQIHNAP